MTTRTDPPMSSCDAHDCQRPSAQMGNDGRRYCSNDCEFRQLRMEAAAPDMLEAIRALISRWDTAGLGSGDERLIESCRAAIAKATGETP